MENSRNKKRGYEQSVEDAADDMPGSKKSKLPALARFALCLFWIEYFLLSVFGCSCLDCYFHKILFLLCVFCKCLYLVIVYRN